jgi:hypothetical protein
MVEKVIIFEKKSGKPSKKVRVFVDKQSRVVAYDTLIDGNAPSTYVGVSEKTDGCEITSGPVSGFTKEFCQKLPDVKEVVEGNAKPFAALIQTHQLGFPPTVERFVNSLSQCDEYRNFLPKKKSRAEFEDQLIKPGVR